MCDYSAEMVEVAAQRDQYQGVYKYISELKGKLSQDKVGH